MARIRQLPLDNEYVLKEIGEIQNQLAEEQEATMGQGFRGILREMFLMPNNFYRIYLGLGSQLLSQWSGAQSITIYAPDFFALLGTKGQNVSSPSTFSYPHSTDTYLPTLLLSGETFRYRHLRGSQIRRRDLMRLLPRRRNRP
jgi:hypothetical protein